LRGPGRGAGEGDADGEAGGVQRGASGEAAAGGGLSRGAGSGKLRPGQHIPVIPAEAGIPLFFYQLGKGSEIPAEAGMTTWAEGRGRAARALVLVAGESRGGLGQGGGFVALGAADDLLGAVAVEADGAGRHFVPG